MYAYTGKSFSNISMLSHLEKLRMKLIKLNLKGEIEKSHHLSYKWLNKNKETSIFKHLGTYPVHGMQDLCNLFVAKRSWSLGVEVVLPYFNTKLLLNNHYESDG